MTLRNLVKSYIDRVVNEKVTDVTIKSLRATGAFEVKAAIARIIQSTGGQLFLELELPEHDQQLLRQSEDSVLDLNRKCIHRDDALHISAVTENRVSISAIAFSINTSETFKDGKKTYHARPSLNECVMIETTQDSAGALELFGTKNNVSYFFEIKDPAPPFSAREQIGACQLLENYGGLNCRDEYCGANSKVLRGAKTLMFTENVSDITKIDEVRLSLETTLSFISGKLHECIGVLEINNDSTIFRPTPREGHTGGHPPAISYNPYVDSSCAPYWEAFKRLKSFTLRQNSGKFDALRRAIAKPLEVERNCPIHIKIVLLLIAIECLTKKFLGEDKAKYDPPKGLEEILKLIESAVAPKDTIDRAKSLVGAMQTAAPRNTLEAFCKRIQLDTKCAENWSNVRNKLAHGEGLNYDNPAELMLQCDQLLTLYHCIILDIINYEGPIRNHLQEGALSNLYFRKQGLTANPPSSPTLGT